MAIETAQILQSHGLESQISAIAAREFGMTDDTERPVLGTTIAGAKFLQTESFQTVATSAPSALAIVRRSLATVVCNLTTAGADIALDIRAGAQSAGYRVNIMSVGTAPRKTVVQYATGVYVNVASGSAQAFLWDGTAWNVEASANALYGMNFDYVIDSDAKFLAWKSMTSGCEKVLVRKGTWTLASGGIPLSTTGTKVVIGESGSRLVFSSSEKGLYYASTPTTLDYYMNGVNISGTYSGSDCYGFYSCTNLTNCTGTGTGNGAGFGYGFHGCTSLTNCTGTGTCTGTGNGYGFQGCTSLTNCTGTGNGTGGDGYGFFNCTALTNCTGTGTDNGYGFGYGFYNCKKCQQNKHGICTTSGYSISYADSGTAYACADTPNGGFNS